MELIRKPAGPPRRVRRLLSYQVGNMQQQGARDYQEDSFCFVNATDVTEIKANGLLALMADGMGGLQDGKAVSETALQAMRAEFAAMDRRGDLAAQLMEAVHRTNALLYSQFGGNGGTTLVACLLFEENLYFASVGDSYLYLLRGGGLSRLNAEQNQCHQQYAALLRQGILDPAPPTRRTAPPGSANFWAATGSETWTPPAARWPCRPATSSSSAQTAWAVCSRPRSSTAA